MFIEELKNKFKKNEPILIEEILKMFCKYTRQRIYQLIEEAIKNDELSRFDRGIYYIPSFTMLGKSTLSIENVIAKKYLNDNNEVYGIGGKNVLDLNFMITTQVPNTLEIITNNESRALRVIKICNQNVILRKSRTKITNDNVFAYTILELFTNISVNEFKRSIYAKKEVIKYINKNNITIDQIYKLTNFFPARTMKNLINCEVIYEFTRRERIIF